MGHDLGSFPWADLSAGFDKCVRFGPLIFQTAAAFKVVSARGIVMLLPKEAVPRLAV
jgi:hypothetical protein